MTIFSTYCSADKNESKELLAAHRRYFSRRIRNVHQAALSLGLQFFILSGKFGLIHCDETIPYYDHLLKAEEVDKHTLKVSTQLKNNKITQVIFFTNPVASDKNLQAYLDCMIRSCEELVIHLSIVDFEIEESSSFIV